MGKIAITLISLSLFLSCNQSTPLNIDFMEGRWKKEGKDQYEVWEKQNKLKFTGYAYTLVNNQENQLETLTLSWKEDTWVYQATVPNQNQGKPISFKLNTNQKEMLSFENLQHDFPKKIQYKKLTNTRVKVSVLGEEGKGFSYIQEKQ